MSAVLGKEPGTDANGPEAVDPATVVPGSSPGSAPKPAGKKLAALACLTGLVEAVLLALSGTGLLLISGLAGGLGSDTLPATSPTLDNDRHELWVVAGFSLAAMLLMLVGALLTLSWVRSRRGLGKVLLTSALAILIFGSFLQTQIADLSVSSWWTGALIGLAVAATGLAWLSARADRGRRPDRYWPSGEDAEGASTDR